LSLSRRLETSEDSVNAISLLRKLLQLRAKFRGSALNAFYLNDILHHSINVVLQEALYHLSNNQE
jgi:uncharacterized protein (DUF1778 family)